MNLASYVDFTILKADATKSEVEALCKEAAENKFAAVCVNTYYVPLVKKLLEGSGVNTCCTIGFPLGAMSTESKECETRNAVEAGAEEVDMVINVGALKDGRDDIVLADIKAVVDAAHPKAAVKVIFETCLLNDEEKVRACNLSLEAGADFVKTSTGFSTGGATVEDVKLMKQTVGDRAKVKASGGIRSKETALAMIEAGASRLGTSRNFVK